MTMETKRPQKKDISAKVSEEDMIYFSLGIDRSEFILPSQRKDYHSDERAVQLVNAIRSGKKMKNIDFSGINLKGADISGGFFEGCQFKKSLFYKTQAETCDFTDCIFDDSYLEESDFMGCDFTGASFKRVFSKNNNFEKAFFDDDALKYLSAVEKIIKLIEAGKIDIRTLAKEDLLHLDIRRLDFSKVDLEDLDLSMFALDGINLCGTYIDPKQLMSLEGWNSYCLDLQKTSEMTRERLSRKLFLDKEKELLQYAQQQAKQSKSIGKTPQKNLHRPLKKQPESEKTRPWGIEKARAAFVAEKEAQLARGQEIAPEEVLLFEKHRKKYGSKEKSASKEAHIVKENSPLKTQETSERAVIADNVKSQAPEKSHSQIQTDEKKKETIGLPVTQERIKALHEELKTEEMFSIISHEVGKAEEKQALPVTQHTEKESPQATENNLNKNINNKEIHVENKEKTKEPVLIVSHEKQEAVTSDKAYTDATQAEALLAAALLSSDQKPLIESQKPEVQPGQKASEDMPPKKAVPSTTPYPYFQKNEEKPEQTPLPLKPADDEEETVHDLKNAGYSMEEIAQILREKGPIKVIGKLPKGQKVRSKTKG